MAGRRVGGSIQPSFFASRTSMAIHKCPHPKPLPEGEGGKRNWRRYSSILFGFLH